MIYQSINQSINQSISILSDDFKQKCNMVG